MKPASVLFSSKTHHQHQQNASSLYGQRNSLRQPPALGESAHRPHHACGTVSMVGKLQGSALCCWHTNMSTGRNSATLTGAPLDESLMRTQILPKPSRARHSHTVEISFKPIEHSARFIVIINGRMRFQNCERSIRRA